MVLWKSILSYLQPCASLSLKLVFNLEREKEACSLDLFLQFGLSVAMVFSLLFERINLPDCHVIKQSLIYKHRMKILLKDLLAILIFFLALTTVSGLLTKKMIKKKASFDPSFKTTSDTGPVITTSCNMIDLNAKYNYPGIAASGYLTVGKNNSALAFLFYGKKDVRETGQLRNYPTVLWLNGGPGSSSQIGNLQQIGPLLIQRQFDITVIQNNYTWANNYNLLFIDQPVGTGLSYADTSNGANPFAKSLNEVADDFYRALYELYNGKGCFSNLYFSIPPSNPLVIFGQSYAGKYVPAIAKKIIQSKQNGGFLTGLKGIAIGDGFTHPYDILSEVGTYSFHLGLIDYQERMKLQKMLLNASRNYLASNWDALHDDFDNALEYIVDQSGVNIYDIRIDGDYQQLLQPYFWNKDISAGIYGFNTEITYDSQADDVYNNLYTDFMQTQINRVEYLLGKGLPILIYNGQDDLIVQNAGTMKWVDKIYYSGATEFRKKLFEPWTLNGKTVGVKKSAGLLQLRIVFNAGHLVPMDRPQEALDMATSFVNRVREM